MVQDVGMLYSPRVTSREVITTFYQRTLLANQKRHYLKSYNNIRYIMHNIVRYIMYDIVRYNMYDFVRYIMHDIVRYIMYDIYIIMLC
jgi:hypothetical protein